MKKTIFITGIDTDCGKTYATGLLAKYLLNQGKNVITQKMIQTGCTEISEDILEHRRLMGIPLQEADKSGLTMPYIFPIPASPHLAAKLANQTIDTDKINSATKELHNSYDIVLLEGAGGLLVPINEQLNSADYILKYNYPTILVTSAKTGSINHTLLTLEAMQKRKIKLTGLIYNHYPQTNTEIINNTRDIICKSLLNYDFKQKIVDLPLNSDKTNSIDFSIFDI